MRLSILNYSHFILLPHKASIMSKVLQTQWWRHAHLKITSTNYSRFIYHIVNCTLYMIVETSIMYDEFVISNNLKAIVLHWLAHYLASMIVLSVVLWVDTFRRDDNCCLDQVN